MNKYLRNHDAHDTSDKIQANSKLKRLADRIFKHAPTTQVEATRHACSICAYKMGYKDGIRASKRRMRSRITEVINKAYA